MSTTKSALFLIGVFGLILACNSPEAIVETPVSVVKPPIPELDLKFETITFANEDGSQWELPSGTSISIPPHSFVDEEGNLISGEMEMKYREMHDAFDIYLSGIPLSTSMGNLSTAGNFEVRAMQSGKDIYLKDSAAIQVRMASFTAGEDYDFWQLDEYGGDWANLGTAKPEINTERKKLIKKISRMKPQLKFPLNQRYMAFNYQAILDIFYNNNWKKMQEDQGLPAQMERYGLRWTESEVHQKIQWKGSDIHAALMVWKNESGKAFPEWTRKRYGRLTEIKGDLYEYHMANQDSTDFFTIKLRAVMPLKALFAFTPEKWTNDYQATMAKVNAEQERLQTMAEVYRSFEVQQMGIYNWDRLIKDEDCVVMNATFSATENQENPLSELTMVYISGDNKMVIKFPEDRWPVLNLPPDQGGRIFCLLPGNKVSLFSAKAYQKIDFQKLKKEENPAYYFAMKEQQQEIKSKDDLVKILDL